MQYSSVKQALRLLKVSIVLTLIEVVFTLSLVHADTSRDLIHAEWLDSMTEIIFTLSGEKLLSPEEALQIVSTTNELVDGKTQKPFKTAGGNILPYFIFEPSLNAECGAENASNVKTILVVGGIHADEVSPLYASFRLMKELHAREKYSNARVIFAPLTNPDGIIGKLKAKRKIESYCYKSNYKGRSLRRSRVGSRHLLNGKDPNRSFFSDVDLDKNENRAIAHQKQISPTENRFIASLVNVYRPHLIISIHGPFGTIDYDGPLNLSEPANDREKAVREWFAQAAKRGDLVEDNGYPGLHSSLGSFGVRNNISVLTVELPNKCGADGPADYHHHGEVFTQLLAVPDEL